MNKTFGAILLLPTLLVCTAGNGQNLSEDKVPDVVKAAFKKQFPQAQAAKWEMEDPSEYEAEFKEGGQKRSASYNTQGEWLQTEIPIKMEELPDAVKKTIASTYAGHVAKEAETVRTPNGSYFEVEMKKDGKTIEVRFNSDGKAVKSKDEAEDEDDDDGKDD